MFYSLLIFACNLDMNSKLEILKLFNFHLEFSVFPKLYDACLKSGHLKSSYNYLHHLPSSLTIVIAGDYDIPYHKHFAGYLSVLNSEKNCDSRLKVRCTLHVVARTQTFKILFEKIVIIFESKISGLGIFVR